MVRSPLSSSFSIREHVFSPMRSDMNSVKMSVVIATTAPYGSWESPIAPAMLTQSGVRLEEVTADGTDLYWVESRPTEAGRGVVVRRSADGAIEDVNPAGFDSRTRVHEYGGGAYAARHGIVISSRFEDQRVYRLDGSEPQPLTPLRR